jgi:hypothetical protein
MTDELKLPQVGELTLPDWQNWLARYDAILGEREQRIEKLEAALRHCINALREYEMGDDRPRGPISNDDLRPWLLGAMDNARKALDAE